MNMHTGVPAVSVVMSVHNGGADLHASIRSILDQTGVDLELIVVDDGSTDDTAALLDQLAAEDARLRKLHQNNQGLTVALARGCALARGRFIARQDCGDISLPGRLRAELDAFEHAPDAALVSCATRFVGPAGELLYEVSIDSATADASLLTLSPQDIRGPAHHGSTMFPRALYEQVGGYRKEFYFAQDLDLWTRMIEHGRHRVIQETFYQASFALGSISSLHRARQIATAQAILECARLRRAGEDESTALAQAALIRPEKQGATPAERAAALYFVGVCLRKRNDARAKDYFRRALRTYPLHLKSAYRFLLG